MKSKAALKEKLKVVHKKKKYVLMIARSFLQTHPRKGDPTGFLDSIQKGDKGHTLRINYTLWKYRVDQIKKGKAVLVLKYWSGKPYRSSPIEICQLSDVGIDKINVERGKQLRIRINDSVVYDEENDYGLDFLPELANNDGLSVKDFLDWFPKSFEGAIIYFTNNKY